MEEFLRGADLRLGIIGNMEHNTVLPIIEEDYSELPEGLPKICGYEAKWLPDSPYMQTLRSIPASLPLATEQELINHSLRLFQRLDCRDYCRFDWRLNNLGEPKLLEANPNPGWCWDGHLAKMSSIGGMDYSQMMEAILNAAELRYNPVNEIAEENLELEFRGMEKFRGIHRDTVKNESRKPGCRSGYIQGSLLTKISFKIFGKVIYGPG